MQIEAPVLLNKWVAGGLTQSVLGAIRLQVFNTSAQQSGIEMLHCAYSARGSTIFAPTVQSLEALPHRRAARLPAGRLRRAVAVKGV